MGVCAIVKYTVTASQRSVAHLSTTQTRFCGDPQSLATCAHFKPPEHDAYAEADISKENSKEPGQRLGFLEGWIIADV